MTILVKLLIAHLLTDFVLQPSSWIAQRREKHFAAPMLYVHGLIAGGLTMVLFWSEELWLIALIITVTHIVIDGLKSYQKDNLTYFVIDQVLHILVIVLVWHNMMMGKDSISPSDVAAMWDNDWWYVLFGYILVTFPVGYFIGFATRKWSKDLGDDDGLDNAGKWIGIAERFIILTFILFEQYEAIGLLVAAKSILRFAEAQQEEVRKKSEYVLIGTLYSLAITLVVGIILVKVLGIG